MNAVTTAQLTLAVRKVIDAAYRAGRNPTVAIECQRLLDSADINATETVYLEHAATVEELETLAMGSLACLLADHRDAKVRAWFVRRGVSF